MPGAIVGDNVGSVYEWDNINTKYFPLFREDCFFTDDTVMTCAVAGKNVKTLQKKIYKSLDCKAFSYIKNYNRKVINLNDNMAHTDC